MMPSSIPQRVRRGPSATTYSEKKVFEHLRAADIDGATGLHSLWFLDAPGRTFGEVDFVVVTRHGLLAIEVKGGYVRMTSEGKYDINGLYQTDSSPLDQAARNSMDLRRWLLSRVTYDVRRVPFGHAAVFPGQSGVIRGMDATPEIVALERQCADSKKFTKWLNECLTYWWEHHRQPMELTDEMLEETVRLLRGEFDVEPAFDHQTLSIMDRQDRFSDEQFDVVDANEENDRLVVTGGAGTGKTFVARALARRAASAGEDVGILLARQGLTPLYADLNADGVRVSAATPLNPPCSFLIVDEGQLLCNGRGFDLIRESVSGGIENGRWRIFLDDQLQARMSQDWDQTYLELLKLAGSRVRLKHNYRNTDQIVSLVSSATGADIGQPRVEEGRPPVILTRESGARSVERAIRGLIGKGAAISNIAVIAGENSDALASELRAMNIEVGGVGAPGVKVLSPEDAQGFEFPHVIAVVGNNLDERGVSRLYVAMTRARVTLTVIDPLGEIKRLQLESL
jgi:hypothetical protein